MELFTFVYLLAVKVGLFVFYHDKQYKKKDARNDL
jgi:hypothetical protein